GRNEEAIKCFQAFIERYPDDKRVTEAMMNLAWRYRAVGNLEKTNAILNELNKRLPDSELGWFALGLMYELEGGKDPSKFEEGVKAYLKAAEYFGDQRPLALLGLGSCYFQLARFTDCLKAFQRVLKEYPERKDFCAEAYYLSARIWVYAGDYKRAIECYRAVVDNYPEIERFVVPALLEIPYCYECLYDFETAIKEYETSMEKFPQYYNDIAPEALLRMGHCYLQLGKIGKALESWQKLQEKFPDLGRLQGTLSLPHIIKLYKDMPNEVPSFVHCSPPSSPKPTVMGPLNVAYRLGLSPAERRKILIIYGTNGDPDENQAMKKRAEQIRDVLRKAAEIKADSEVSEEECARRHLHIIGNPRCNSLLGKINDKLPIKMEGNSLIAGERKYQGKGIGAEMVIPSPFNPERCAVIELMLSPKDYMSLFKPAPYWNVDYAILDMENNEVVREEGFFIKHDPINWEVPRKGGE
ncbi:MAG: tetratricopeptide repeat protein, partial [bacterium]